MTKAIYIGISIIALLIVGNMLGFSFDDNGINVNGTSTVKQSHSIADCIESPMKCDTSGLKFGK